MTDRIAIIVEGADREKEIWTKIASVFFPRSEFNTVCLPAGTIIYDMWKQLKKDDFQTDIIELVREISPKAAESLGDWTRDDFSQLYLFFDLDPQQNNLPNNQDPFAVLSEMLETFDNETENGKLYISYPMIEALWDIRENDCKSFRDCCLVSSDTLKKRGAEQNPYKHDTGTQNSMSNYQAYTRQSWEMLIAIFLHRCLCLFAWRYNLTPPEGETLQEWYRNNVNPMELFQAEKALMRQYQQIFVLSAFPEFLLDYFKPTYWNTFPPISHGVHFGDSCTGLNSILST